MRNITTDKRSIIFDDHRAGRISRAACILLGFLFIPVLGDTAARTTPDQFVSSIDLVKRSVIPILCAQFDAQGKFSYRFIDGTGFFIDEDAHFVTAAHVIADLKQKTCIMAIYIPRDGWRRNVMVIDVNWLLFKDCKVDDSLDLAVCKPVGQVPTRIYPLTFDILQPLDGMPVAFTGFPLGFVQPLSSRGNVAAYRKTVDENGARELIIDKGTWPGASGSPVYSPEGKVVGIILARGTDEATGIAVALPASFIIKFLHDNGIDIPTKTQQKKRKK